MYVFTIDCLLSLDEETPFWKATTRASFATIDSFVAFVRVIIILLDAGIKDLLSPTTMALQSLISILVSVDVCLSFIPPLKGVPLGFPLTDWQKFTLSFLTSSSSSLTLFFVGILFRLSSVTKICRVCFTSRHLKGLSSLEISLDLPQHSGILAFTST